MAQDEVLLEAAIVCLQERGYSGATSRDIARVAGVSMGAIAYHYGKKERLVHKAITESFRRWFRELGRLAAAADHARPARGIAEVLADTFERNRPMAVAFVEAMAQAGHSEEVRAELAEMYRVGRAELCAVVDRMLRKPGVDSRASASVLIAIFDGLLLQWLLDPSAPPFGKDLIAASSSLAELIGGDG
jgi:AcrR family transcriptional regulator